MARSDTFMKDYEGLRPMGDYSTIELSETDDRAIITLDRPEKKNAINPDLCRELPDALVEIRGGQCSTVTITGKGDAFCSGMDLEEFFEGPRNENPERVAEYEREQFRMVSTLKNFPLPTIAKVNGWALGGGYLLSSICDFSIADEEAKFGLPEINFGIFPAGGAMWAAVHTMDRRKAMYFAATGEYFTGARAEELGVVTFAVAGEELEERVSTLCETLAEKNPIALKYNKEVFEKSVHMDFEESWDYEMAKSEKMKFEQNQEWLEEGIGQFSNREYRPGVESYRRG